MANTVFEATYFASQQITSTFDMVWAIDAGLWNLRQAASQYLIDHPDASVHEAKDALVNGLYVHGLNLKRISTELSWEYEEQFISELLLINGISIFDTWVDEFVDSAVLSPSSNKRKKIKENVKKGIFSDLDSALSQEPSSSLSGCFHFSAKRQDNFINKLIPVYKYFKHCRNCCAHGNRKFSREAENDYEAIKNFTKEDCGVKEFPQIAVTKSGDPLKLFLRGVVGFYDILIRIINHYDVTAADKVAVESELCKRWTNIQGITLSANENKRNNSIRNYFVSINMCPPYVAKTTDVYNYLVAHNAIK